MDQGNLYCSYDLDCPADQSQNQPQGLPGNYLNQESAATPEDQDKAHLHSADAGISAMSAHPSDVIIIHESGLSPTALKHVLSPFGTSRKFSGIKEAAEQVGIVNEDLDDDTAYFARVALQSR